MCHDRPGLDWVRETWQYWLVISRDGRTDCMQHYTLRHFPDTQIGMHGQPFCFYCFFWDQFKNFLLLCHQGDGWRDMVQDLHNIILLLHLKAAFGLRFAGLPHKTAAWYSRLWPSVISADNECSALLISHGEYSKGNIPVYPCGFHPLGAWIIITFLKLHWLTAGQTKLAPYSNWKHEFHTQVSLHCLF